MKKTALAKQIAYVKSKQNEYKIGSDAYNALREVEIVMSAGLEEERQNLMDAFLDGKVNGNDWFTVPNTVDIDKDQYFNENYEQ